jgi:EAL domain-containing protein (putative c-di-GMP-specific phosphodiesterase class I)/GGDEF domain-containing protein
MYTYSQLLVRNFVFSCVFSVAVAGISGVLLMQYSAQQQQLHIKQLNAFAKNIDDNTTNELAAIKLASLNQYATLNINNDQGTNIFKHQQKVQSPLTQLLVAPAQQLKLENNSLNIGISFQLDFSPELSLFYKLIFIVFGTSLVFVIVAGFFSIGRYKVLTEKINSQIKRDLSLIIDEKNDHQSDVNHNTDEIELPELQQHLTELRTLIESKISATSLLEKSAFVEPVTQLENRNRFVQFFENDERKSDFGVLSITRCSELQTINQIHGYHEGDGYIRNVANIMKNAITTIKGAQVYRLNSSDFATLIPNITLKGAEAFANDLTGRFNEYQQASDLDSVACTGLVYYDNSRPLGELLALADTGISIAQTQQTNAWFAQTDASILDSNSASYGNQNWRQEIDSVIENQRVNLLVQQIKPSSPTSKAYSEILARFLNANDDILPTASFIAMAEKLDKIVAVDRMIIEAALTEITEKNLHEHFFGINVSARSINDGHFLIWLERRLLKDPQIAAKLIFEITEYGLQQNIKTSKNFIDMIHRVGAKITVERFGVGLTSFKFFRDLKPDFIKMDSTYTRDIDEDKNNQYFLRLMVDLAHRLSINVLAESVETQEENFMLEKLFIDGCQGFYIGKPKRL